VVIGSNLGRNEIGTLFFKSVVWREYERATENLKREAKRGCKTNNDP